MAIYSHKEEDIEKFGHSTGFCVPFPLFFLIVCCEKNRDIDLVPHYDQQEYIFHLSRQPVPSSLSFYSIPARLEFHTFVRIYTVKEMRYEGTRILCCVFA